MKKNDLGRAVLYQGDCIFQPTRPLRGATCAWIVENPVKFDFNPRAPCGARPPHGARLNTTWKFQPTRPLRGATGAHTGGLLAHSLFQPTRPLRGATAMERWEVTVNA